MRLRLFCPAKVNLHLEVLGRRSDGFHELRTLYAAVGVWDELELEAAPAGILQLEVIPQGLVSDGPDNLVLRAARALQACAGITTGARMTLRKRIPVAAGLGGGSSDAAGALVALAQLWGCDGDLATLVPLAASLGSDVPFFLVGGAAWGVGRGGEIYPLPDLEPWWVVLLPGEMPVSTKEVYARVPPRELGSWRPSAVYHWIVRGGELPLAACRNELEPVVIAGWPGVSSRLEALREARPELALVSGSGGAVFALFAGEPEALEVGRRLAAYHPLVAPVLARQDARLRPQAGR
ncbi:MAG: 4-(cytidine 5'-diphospho)-2-C-methyl-D-erythritol kinase [Acidobacteriota bacterium]